MRACIWLIGMCNGGSLIVGGKKGLGDGEGKGLDECWIERVWVLSGVDGGEGKRWEDEILDALDARG